MIPDLLLPGADPGVLFRLLLTALVATLLLLVVVTAVLVAYRARNERRRRRWTRLEESWRPHLEPVLAGEAPPRVLQDLVPRGDEDFFLRYLTVRGTATPAERARLESLAAPYMDRLDGRLEDSEPETRALAVRTAGLLAPDRFRDRLTTALDDPAPLVVTTAAMVLMAAEDGLVRRRIVARLSELPDWDARALATILLRGGPRCASTLREVLADSSSTPREALVAAGALREMEDEASADVAARRLDAEAGAEYPDLRAFLLRLLARVGGERHLPAIRRRADDPELGVRVAVIRALGALGDDEDLIHLATAVSDPSPWVALSAVEALAQHGHTNLLEALAENAPDVSTFAHQVLAKNRLR